MNTKEGRKIFEDEKGNPIVFYFRPCATRSKVQPIVEEHGGTVTARLALNAIKLANDDDFLVTEDNYSVRYIEDCVKAKKLLEKENYRLQPRKIAIRSASEDEVSDISFDDNNSLILKASSKHFKGRKPYSYDDDMKILYFIIKNGYHEKVAGIKLWEEMEELGITQHSASSMNTRYRKFIKFHLTLYPIPLKHKIKLNTDYLASPDEKDISPEKKTAKSPQKNPGTGKKSPHSSPQIKILSKSPKASTPAKQNVEKSQNGTKSGSKSPSPPKTASLSSPPRPASTGKSKYFTRSSEDSGELSNDEAIKGRKRTRKLQFVTSTSKKTGAESPLKVSTTTDDESSEPVKKRVGRPRKKPLAESEVSQESETQVGGTSFKAQKGSPSLRRTSSRNRKMAGDPESLDTAKTGKTDRQSNVQNLEKKSHKTLYNTEGSTLTPGQVTEIPKSPSKSNQAKTSIGCLFKTTSNKASSPRKSTAVNTRSSSAENANMLDDSIDNDELEDDFDKELLKHVAKTSTQVSDDEGTSTPKKRRLRSKLVASNSQSPRQEKTSDKLGSGKSSNPSEETLKKSSKNTRKTSSTGPRKSKTRTTYVTVFNDEEESVGTTEIAQEDVVMENCLEKEETKDLILTLCREYQLTVKQVRYVLFINNGDVNESLEWLRTSGERNGKLTWDMQDDDKLDGDLEQLYRKYGESEVQKRILFLDQL